MALAKPATTAQNVEDDDRDQDQLRRLARRVVLAVGVVVVVVVGTVAAAVAVVVLLERQGDGAGLAVGGRLLELTLLLDLQRRGVVGLEAAPRAAATSRSWGSSWPV